MDSTDASRTEEDNEKVGLSPNVSTHAESNVKHKGLRPGKFMDGGGPGRKSKACHECRKLKMRCETFPGDRKCRHCLRRKVECVFKSSSASMGNGDDLPLISMERYEQKIDSMRREIELMRRSLDTVIAERQPQIPDNQCLTIQNPPTVTPGSTASPAGLSSREDNTQMAMTRENSLEPAPNNDQGNGAVTVEEPMNSLYEVTRLRNIRSNRAKTARTIPGSQGELNDFISRGVISEHEAEELYKTFHMSLNHYLWVGLEQTHHSFHSVRKSSELLTATILAVTAMHIPTSAETFDKCYKEFLALISSSMFSRYHSIDDVRGLCIAAFWLSEVSWKLSGHAIRIATELNIHQSFAKALEGDREHFLRARLWYMLYVCDHHFSIAYGRPPMIAESTQIREHELFLASPFAGPLDARILSQVSLMQILTRVYERFAVRRLPDPHTIRYGTNGSSNDSSVDMLEEEDFSDLRNFNLEIEQWRMRWYARQQSNSFIGTFPPKGIILYSYFAKLQLNILAVRGVSLNSGRLSTERKEFTNMAISAAASILTFVLEEEDMRRALVGTPLYVHTMIAFASVFLMKVATKWNRLMGFNIEHSYLNVSHLLKKMIILLKSSITSDRHVLHHIANGLEKMLAEMTAEAGEEEQGRPLHVLQPEQFDYHKGSNEVITAPGIGFGPPPVQLPSTGWDAYAQQTHEQDFFGNGSTFMNDNLLYEAFGAESSSDVYSFLSSHFS
ncbi:Transcriptional activator of proteases prtT [Neonectria ditissima]|uniref:Transcriptional activator of proteases prtT n=1 Tax=Neonectria ditissima TaxID=78410 RepID=A0A0P7BW87_9HYPO|nr:Transcriptional activator of proteases prtT [Neonectria ditissima]